ncbi:MAG TPA: outer membrane beta-barrel protein [Geobacteraceae bacterium]
MRTILGALCLAAALACAAAPAQAQNIKGKVGVTGQIGFIIPADSDIGPDKSKLESDAGFIGGGGLIYGIDRNWAAELNVSYTNYDTQTHSGSLKGDFDLTNISLGGQYRFEITAPNLVPYAGAGLDILVGDFGANDNRSYDVDTTVGVHLSGGIDYFITKNVALNAEAKVVIAPETDIKLNGITVGNFDPSGFSGLFGVRFFFN